VVEPKKIEDMKNPGLTGYVFKPMWITFKHMIKKNRKEDWWTKRPVTLLYPHEKDEMGKSYRGLLAVNDAFCIGCGLCARDCPNACLEMLELGKEGDKAKKRPQAYLGRCMFCGLCAENCPTGAFHLTEEYELADVGKGVFILTPEMLDANVPVDLRNVKKEPPDTYPALDRDICISCKLCAKNCPEGAIEMTVVPGTEKTLADGRKGKPKELPIFDYSKCLWCQLCEDKCKPQSISFIKNDKAKEINEETRRFIKSKGGGVAEPAPGTGGETV
jgi:formate hydrogenlyase subunit 6/NADH:ubiquinone oxidoreductase subunit I